MSQLEKKSKKPDSFVWFEPDREKWCRQYLPEAHFHPLNFADVNYEMNWQGNSIKIGDQMFAKGWLSYHPGNFPVISIKHWNKLERHQLKLDAFYEGKLYPLENVVAVKDDPRFFVDPALVQSGLFVAVKHRAQWHRGMIVENNLEGDKSECIVLMIDYGDHRNYPVKRLRRIPVRFLDFPAQAIRCSLYFDGNAAPLNKEGYEWTAEEAENFRDIMKDCRYLVEFVCFKILNDFPKYPLIWNCRIHLAKEVKTEDKEKIETKQDKKVKKETRKWVAGGDSVADLFLTKLQRLFAKQEENKIKDKRFNKRFFEMKEAHEQNKKKLGQRKKGAPWHALEDYEIPYLKFSDGINESLDDFNGFIIPNDTMKDGIL